VSSPRPPERSDDEEMSAGERGQQAYGLGRILALSDGVFGFSLTLLVVSLAAPTATSNAALASQLVDQVPNFISYIITFAAGASIWYGHHETFKYIRRYDQRLIVLNFGSLLLIAFLPFPTAVLGRNQQLPLAAVFYAVTLVLGNLLFAATWWYASHGRRLVSRDLSPHVSRRRYYRTLSGAAAFFVTIPIALWRPIVAEILWSLFLVAMFAILWGAPRPGRRESPT